MSSGRSGWAAVSRAPWAKVPSPDSEDPRTDASRLWSEQLTLAAVRGVGCRVSEQETPWEVQWESWQRGGIWIAVVEVEG